MKNAWKYAALRDISQKRTKLRDFERGISKKRINSRDSWACSTTWRWAATFSWSEGFGHIYTYTCIWAYALYYAHVLVNFPISAVQCVTQSVQAYTNIMFSFIYPHIYMYIYIHTYIYIHRTKMWHTQSKHSQLWCAHSSICIYIYIYIYLACRLS